MKKNDILKRLYTFIAALLFANTLFAQPTDVKLSSPFDFDILLSASFGELRSNHFHSGLDFKTQGVVGKPIKCVADGYIYRARVQAGSYGLSLYVMHDGFMTLYAHLDRFPQEIAKRVRDNQYARERFEVDLYFGADEYPVKRGDFLAYAGNTGYSFGPHLHYEVRNTSGERIYNPLSFYKELVVDTRPPKASAIAVYPRVGSGAVGGDSFSRSYKVKNGVVSDTIDVWGDVGFGVDALDFMDNTSNKYGVYRVELFVDGERCFVSQMDDFTFNEYKLITACVDRRREDSGEGSFQKMFITDNNPFGQYSAGKSRGWVCIDSERLYNVECRLTDYHGNSSSYALVLRGSRCAIPQAPSGECLRWNVANRVEAPGVRLNISRGEMYENALIEAVPFGNGCELVGQGLVSGDDVAFWHGAKLSLSADSMQSVPKSKLCIVKVTEKDTTWMGGSYVDGWVTAKISSLGRYELSADTIPPVLKPINEAGWMADAKLLFSLSDGESSVSSFKGTLNGKFVLFKYNRKEKRLTFDLKQENIRRGDHRLKVVAVDAHGNRTVFEKDIKY